MIRWHAKPRAASFARAERLLAAEASPAEALRLVNELRTGTVEQRPASVILRRSRRLPLPADDPRVVRELDRAKAGKKLRPVLVASLEGGRAEIADGLHRVSAAFHIKSSSPVAVIARGQSTHTRGPQMAKKSKIEKADISAAARSAVERAAQVLGPHSDEPRIAALVSKLEHIAAAREPEHIGKHQDTLVSLDELRKRDDLDAHTQEVVRNSNRELQLRYLQDMSPAAAAAWQASQQQARR